MEFTKLNCKRVGAGQGEGNIQEEIVKHDEQNSR